MTKLKTILNEKNKKMKKADYIILGIIVTLYSIVSLINLGSLKNPQTFLKFKYNEEVVFEFQQESDIGRMMFYTGRGISEYYLYTSIDGKEFNYIQNVYGEKTYSWSDINVYQRAKYIKLKATNNRYEMGEIAFYNTKNKQIIPQKITTTNKENTKNKKNLCDEKDSVPKKVNYLNSTYFDEIYFARSAYEYTKGEKVYEWTHPPLGKLIQAIPIKLSGKMTTFNYRLMGNLAGITMIIVMYLFGKLLFEKRKYAVFSSLLMSLDTFHFAHTRMGTVDSFLVLFIMLSYYYMAKFLSDSKNHKNLFLSGLFFGLSITVKWTGFYAGLGLAIIFFTYIIKKKLIQIKLLEKCTVFFVVIPLLIYIGSYLLFPKLESLTTNSIPNIIKQTQKMYEYHSGLKEQHLFSSKWYSWPISYRPVWYYSCDIDENHRGTITGVGNIVIWWMGILAFAYLLFRLIRKKDKHTYFLIIAMLSMWLPYIFIGRVMFLYHYFPVLPFLMLGIVTLFHDFVEKTKFNYVIPIYLILVLAFFVIYFPVISGNKVSNDYIKHLKLFESWYF